MVWIKLTAVPNAEHLDHPRAGLLVNTDRVMCFAAIDSGQSVINDSFNPDSPSIQVAESLEDIEQLIGSAQWVDRTALVLGWQLAQHGTHQPSPAAVTGWPDPSAPHASVRHYCSPACPEFGGHCG